FSLLGALVVLFLLAPLVKMMFSAQPGGLAAALADSEVRGSIALTLGCALWATLTGALLGVPLAYLLARRSFFGKRFIEALVDIPIVIPHPVAGIALLLVFGRQFFGVENLFRGEIVHCDQGEPTVERRSTRYSNPGP